MPARDLNQLRADLQSALPRLARQYAVASLSIFGSRVRGEQRTDSDLDLLVRFERKPGLLRFTQLENELTDLLGIRVDLVLEDALKDNIGKRVKQELLSI